MYVNKPLCDTKRWRGLQEGASGEKGCGAGAAIAVIRAMFGSFISTCCWLPSCTKRRMSTFKKNQSLA